MPKIDTTVRELVDMVTRGELKLPEMQRRYVWPATRVRDLLDSLYRNYPSGSILVWQTDQTEPTRNLAVEQATTPFAGQKMLLDGQQRLTSLTAVLNGLPVSVRNRKRPIEILFNLDHPDGPPAELTEVEEDQDNPALSGEDVETEESAETAEPNIQERLGKRTFVVASRQLLSDPRWVKVSSVLKGQLTDRQILQPLGITSEDPIWEKYSARLQKLRAIREYPYVMQVLGRELAYEEVAEIFVRVNSLGVKLRGSDLALAQITARWKGSLKLFEDFSEQITANSWFDLDAGLLVKAMVIFATEQSRFATLQNVSVDRLEKGWEKAKAGLLFAINFLTANVGIEDESLLSSPFIILTVAAFGIARKQELSAKDEEQLKRWVLIANARGRYSRGSTETLLDQDLAVIFRRGSLDELFALIKQQVGRLHVEADDFVGRNARNPLFATAYLALKRNGAKDWLSGLGLSLTHQGRLHFIEYHHIFPKSLLSQANFEPAAINEIANLAFISGKANRRILNSPPAEYLPAIIESAGEDALLTQCIPIDKSLWKIEAYPQFLQWRRERLADEINALLGTSPEEEAANR